MILSTMILAAVTATGSPPPGTYRYGASMNGQAIGSWSVTVARDESHTQIDENSTASVFGMQLSATASLVLGPDLAPANYRGSYHTPSQSPNVSVSVDGGTATVVGALTPQPQRFPLAANTKHFVVIEPGLLAGLFMLPAQLAAWQDRSVTWITPATSQVQALTTSTGSAPPRPADVAPQDAVLAIDQPVGVTIWYDPATLVPDEINVPSQNAVLKRLR